jgi:hypothetical protein
MMEWNLTLENIQGIVELVKGYFVSELLVGAYFSSVASAIFGSVCLAAFYAPRKHGYVTVGKIVGAVQKYERYWLVYEYISNKGVLKTDIENGSTSNLGEYATGQQIELIIYPYPKFDDVFISSHVWLKYLGYGLLFVGLPQIVWVDYLMSDAR